MSTWLAARARSPAVWPSSAQPVSIMSHRVRVRSRKLLEDLCYELLACAHSGWENNDGAFGVFVFDIAKRSIELEFSARYRDARNLASHIRGGVIWRILIITRSPASASGVASPPTTIRLHDVV